jgi:hypothetical protein
MCNKPFVLEPFWKSLADVESALGLGCKRPQISKDALQLEVLDDCNYVLDTWLIIRTH